MKTLAGHEAYKKIRATSVRKARIEAVCNFCGKKILIGDSYIRWVGAHEGSFLSVPCCSSCVEVENNVSI